MLGLVPGSRNLLRGACDSRSTLIAQHLTYVRVICKDWLPAMLVTYFTTHSSQRTIEHLSLSLAGLLSTGEGWPQASKVDANIWVICRFTLTYVRCRAIKGFPGS
jgi:hypothetical protein